MKRLQGSQPTKNSELSLEIGISRSTLYKWRKQATSPDSTTSRTSPHLRSAEEKLRLVSQAQELEGQELGEFLRREGVYLAQLDEWQSDIMRALKPLSQKRKTKTKEEKAVAKRIKQLEAELKRKDAALAEAAALLLLAKKVEALWEEEDVNTTPSSERTSSK